MAKYIFDTSVLIDFSKNYESVKSKILQMILNDEELGVCAISITEFYAGIPSKEFAKWNDFFLSLQYWDISIDAARRAGEYRYLFARQGKVLTTMDTIIAAVARENNATILTSNVKDFPMDDVKILNLKA